MKAPKIQREHVIQTALALLDEVGLEGLTMRKLAQTLRVQAPSLYWHFESKQTLIDGMADALVDRVARDISQSLPWEDRVRRVAGELRQALLRHRDGARVYAGTYVVTENVLRTSEAMILGFVQAGADAGLAATASFSVAYYVLGFVMEEQALGPGSDIDLTERKQAFMDFTQVAYPHSLAAQDTIFSDDFDSRFVNGLDLLLLGFRQKILAMGCNVSTSPGG